MSTRQSWWSVGGRRMSSGCPLSSGWLVDVQCVAGRWPFGGQWVYLSLFVCLKLLDDLPILGSTHVTC